MRRQWLRMSIKKWKRTFPYFFLPLFLFIVVFTLLVHLSENPHNPQFSDLRDTIWWALTTITTVGYGDKVPQTHFGKLFASWLMVTDLFFVSFLTAFVASVLVEKRMENREGLSKIRSEKHLIIGGRSPVLYKILEEIQKWTPRKIVVWIGLEEDIFLDVERKFSDLNLSFVYGDTTQEEAWERASLKRASAVILIADTEGKTPSGKWDEKTVISASLVKHIAPSVYLSCELLSSYNEPHLRRLEVDEIILSQEYGGALIAQTVVNPGLSLFMKEIFLLQDKACLRRISLPDKWIGLSYSRICQECLQNNWILLALMNEAKRLSPTDIFADDTSGIDQFIRRKLSSSQSVGSWYEGFHIQFFPDMDKKLYKDDMLLILEKRGKK